MFDQILYYVPRNPVQHHMLLRLTKGRLSSQWCPGMRTTWYWVRTLERIHLRLQLIILSQCKQGITLKKSWCSKKSDPVDNWSSLVSLASSLYACMLKEFTICWPCSWGWGQEAQFRTSACATSLLQCRGANNPRYVSVARCELWWACNSWELIKRYHEHKYRLMYGLSHRIWGLENVLIASTQSQIRIHCFQQSLAGETKVSDKVQAQDGSENQCQDSPP